MAERSRLRQSTPTQVAYLLALATLVSSIAGAQVEEASAVLPASLDRLEPAVAELVRRAAQEVEADSGVAETHGRLGMVYEANNLWPEAESSYERAVALEQKDERWRFRLAVASRQNGHLERSLELLQELAKERPELAPVQQRLALAMLERGELASARIHFQRLIDLEPRAAQGYTGLAHVSLLEGDAAAAASLLESALRLRPEDRQAHYLLGLAYRALGRQDEASRELARGLGATPSYLPDAQSAEIERLAVNLTARLDRAGRHLALGQAEPAVQLLETVLGDHPDNLQVMNNLAIAYLRLNKIDDAFALLERARTIDDEGFATYLNLSACYMRLGRLDEALAATDGAVARAPEISKTHLGRAGVLGAMGRLEDARVSLETVIDLEPDSLRAHLMLGRVFELLSQPEAAAAQFTAALVLAPDDLVAWLGLATARLELGEMPAARDALERARNLAPEHPRVIDLSLRMAAEGGR